MIVVSNTSPIFSLSVVEHESLLEQLYGRIFVPNAVIGELSALASERQRFEWIEAQAVSNRALIRSLRHELDIGEAEAIALAVEMNADLLLIDERLGRGVASRLGLKYIGVLGVLIEAKEKGLITSIKPIVDNLITRAGFWMSVQLYSHVLQTAGKYVYLVE